MSLLEKWLGDNSNGPFSLCHIKKSENFILEDLKCSTELSLNGNIHAKRLPAFLLILMQVIINRLSPNKKWELSICFIMRI